MPLIRHRLPTCLAKRPPWLWLLGLVVALQCLGMAKPILLQDGSNMYRYLTKQVDVAQSHDAEASDALAALISGDVTDVPLDAFSGTDEAYYQQHKQQRIKQVDRGIGLGLCLITFLALACPYRSRVTVLCLLALACFVAVDAYCAKLNAGKAFSELSPYSIATRVAAPLALGLAIFATRRRPKGDASHAAEKHGPCENTWQPWSTRTGFVFDGLIRLAIAITFVAHGYKAICGHPPFQDLIALSARRIGLMFDVETTLLLMRIIGWQDILLAGALLLFRHKALLYWVACWGIITAFSRMTAMGFTVYDMTLIRAANGGLALVLLLFWTWHQEKINKSTNRFGWRPL